MIEPGTCSDHATTVSPAPAATPPRPSQAMPDRDAVVAFMRDTIPMARALDVRCAPCADDQFALAAPLPPNINDKGCAFGGSLVSTMTLCAWALVELTLRRHAVACDVFVADSSVRYLAPVWGNFRARAQVATDGDWDTFLSTLRARGKARIDIVCAIDDGQGGAAATLTAHFVAKRRAAPAAGA